MPTPFQLAQHAQQRRWLPDDPLALDIIARLIDQEQPVTIVQQAGSNLPALPEHVQHVTDVPSNPDPAVPLVIVSDRLLGPRPDVDRLVILRPPTLALGIASRRDLALEDLQEAVRLFCRKAGYSQQSIMAVAASARRRSLLTLDDYAEHWGIPLLLYDDQVLTRTPLPPPGKLAGTCAVAAILAAGVTAPVVHSTPFFGKMSLALARRKE